MSDRAAKLKNAARLSSDEFKTKLYEDQGAYKAAPHWDTLKASDKHEIAQFYAEKADDVKQFAYDYAHVFDNSDDAKKTISDVEKAHSKFMMYLSDLNRHIKDVEPVLIELEKMRLKSPKPLDENSEPSKKIKAVLTKLGEDIQEDKKRFSPLGMDNYIADVLQKSSDEIVPKALMVRVKKEAQKELSHEISASAEKLNFDDILKPQIPVARSNNGRSLKTQVG